jgi:hypothetical protein
MSYYCCVFCFDMPMSGPEEFYNCSYDHSSVFSGNFLTINYTIALCTTVQCHLIIVLATITTSLGPQTSFGYFWPRRGSLLEFKVFFPRFCRHPIAKWLSLPQMKQWEHLSFPFVWHCKHFGGVFLLWFLVSTGAGESSLKSFAVAWSVSSDAWQTVVCIFTCSSSAIIASKSPKTKIKIRKSRI